MRINSWIAKACLGALLLSGVAACESVNKPTTTTTPQDYWYAYPSDNSDGRARPAPAPRADHGTPPQTHPPRSGTPGPSAGSRCASAALPPLIFRPPHHARNYRYNS